MKRASAFAAALLSFPAAALAAGEGHGPDHTHLVYLIDFLILAIPAAILLAPRIRKHLGARTDDVRARIAEAEAAFAEAETRMQAAEARIAQLSAEVDRLMAEFTELGRTERDALAADGVAMAAKVRDEADFRIAQALKMARTELATEVVTQAFAQVEARLVAQGGRPVGDAVVRQVVEGVRGAGPA
jgi:F0F1-type ATP synthase membrane subunit b/b'